MHHLRILQGGNKNESVQAESLNPLTIIVRENLQLLVSTFVTDMTNGLKKDIARNPKAAQALGAITAFKPMITKYLETLSDDDAQTIYTNASSFVQAVQERLAQERPQ